MVPCPICGEKKMFRSTTNAVQHVESGACGGCKGKEKAREQIYKFISNKKVRRLLYLSIFTLSYRSPVTCWLTPL